MNSLRIRTN